MVPHSPPRSLRYESFKIWIWLYIFAKIKYYSELTRKPTLTSQPDVGVFNILTQIYCSSLVVCYLFSVRPKGLQVCVAEQYET